jgi:hypothetical protein
MARSIRIQSAGAYYHVMARGNRREDIFQKMTSGCNKLTNAMCCLDMNGGYLMPGVRQSGCLSKSGRTAFVRSSACS